MNVAVDRAILNHSDQALENWATMRGCAAYRCKRKIPEHEQKNPQNASPEAAIDRRPSHAIYCC
jgi:hypothetical protein